VQPFPGFPSASAVAYVVGMAEVAVGFGAQLGRLAGGALYDLGGFGCPFLSAAVCRMGRMGSWESW